MLASVLAWAAAATLNTDAEIAARDERTDARDDDAPAEEETAAREAARTSDGELTDAAVVELAGGVAVFAAHPVRSSTAQTPPNDLIRPMIAIIAGFACYLAFSH
jgi:hypothetical protein